MDIGIVGLGLIGGSLAKAVKENTNYKVFAYDINHSVNLQAKLERASDGILDKSSLSKCDFLLIALYPEEVIKYVKENAKLFKKNAVIIDCAGIKTKICRELKPVAEKNSFVFIGGHPMAGTQNSGFKYSRGSLFKGASMILTAYPEDIIIIEKVKKFFIQIGFGSVVFTTPEEHDRRIAYTSQLAHIVSNAYVKNSSAAEHKGFSAGSYKDLTRVARLNEDMWTELIMENNENVVSQLTELEKHLAQYKAAIKAGDKKALKELFREGRERKEKIERGRSENNV